MKPKSGGLCHRCEHRAAFLETGERPRAECGSQTSKYGCYMYRPVRPCILVTPKTEHDITKKYGVARPVGGPAFISARDQFLAIADGDWCMAEEQGGHLYYFLPSKELMLLYGKQIKTKAIADKKFQQKLKDAMETYEE